MSKKIGVIGAGYWGKNLIRNFSELNSLYAICDSNKDILENHKNQYPSAKFYTAADDMISDPNIDGVVIASPAELHHALGKKALLMGKDVFIEKPIALNYTDGEELVSIAEKNSLILMVGHILEYHPAVIKIKDLIEKGDIGKILYIYSNRLNLGKFRTEENILWSFAPHDISVILCLLGEMPVSVFAQGGNYLNENITDVTVTNLSFSSGVKAHIFVNWLHPYKEQRLVVVGDKRMVVFNDVDPKHKLVSFSHKIDWIDRMPVPQKESAEPIEFEESEPLKNECSHFLDCLESRIPPKTDGQNGLRVLRVLEASQKSLEAAQKVNISDKAETNKYFVHPSSIIDSNVEIGEGTKIWHFSHILKNSRLGENCSLGQNVVVGPNVTIGNNAKIQNNVSVYEGVTLEDDVFCGPSMVFTNVINPRSHWPRKDEFKTTLVREGASFGANSTVVCGVTIGKYAFVGAGSLVNKDVPDYALVYGVPARIKGWMCYCGTQLELTDSMDSNESASCSNCSKSYTKRALIVKEIKEKNN